MSVTYHLTCEKCREQLWVGQSRRLYKAPNHLRALEEFIFRHEGHELKCLCGLQLYDGAGGEGGGGPYAEVVEGRCDSSLAPERVWEFIDLRRKIYAKDGVGGELHVVLDDHNIEAEFVKLPRDYADPDAAEMCRMLCACSLQERAWLVMLGDDEMGWHGFNPLPAPPTWAASDPP